MNYFLEIPPMLASACLKHATLIPLTANTICYRADISIINQIRQSYTLERPNYLENASAKRLNEFFAGRILAQAILQQYFNCLMCINSMQLKLPQWPKGFIGSISHSNEQVIVAISSQSEYLGIDIERIVETSFAEESAVLILTPCEQKLWQAEISHYLNFRAYLTLIFSLKESLYKAVYPVAQNYIDFLEATTVEMNMKNQSAILKFDQKTRQRYRLKPEYEGYWQFNNDDVITYIVQSN
ncbi:4'-phosphopantetheinyl transferase superfamily protein [Acinetobacter vivianii]|uniref:4'-phosphopantetheinyl transferase family protein n=1 Tax=Acinetobacter vivianii TaxID=1776742 RepID=UPI002DBFFF37|nr:4'-phosphopantetheinyl transferase superfamily protein [Acinetobacter vivianii]MEB6665728.1 4'-phosphopantetheinyl transferase superfamily protein [Acinetobacter vivianii]